MFYFFFSSRRRHTRSLCDWSSDVCSSDLLGFEAGADDEFGRAAADIDDQAPLRGRRKTVRHAEIDQARFFAPVNDFYGKPERSFRFGEELPGILGDAQRAGADNPHRSPWKPAQPLAEAPER